MLDQSVQKQAALQDFGVHRQAQRGFQLCLLAGERQHLGIEPGYRRARVGLAATFAEDQEDQDAQQRHQQDPARCGGNEHGTIAAERLARQVDRDAHTQAAASRYPSRPAL